MNNGRTHWEGCWKEHGHSECSVEHVRGLETENESLRAQIADVQRERDDALTHMRDSNRGAQVNAMVNRELADKQNILMTERDAAMKDAERYRWMKKNVKRIPLGWQLIGWDAAIDASDAGGETAMTDLKPCPFCGGTVVDFVNGSSPHAACLKCVACAARGPEVPQGYFGRDDLADAIKWWNERKT